MERTRQNLREKLITVPLTERGNAHALEDIAPGEADNICDVVERADPVPYDPLRAAGVRISSVRIMHIGPELRGKRSLDSERLGASYLYTYVCTH